MILFIDTSDFNNIHFALLATGTDKSTQAIKEFTTAVAFNENYKTNDFLEKFLRKNKLTPKAISKVIVCSGPGSFTGIRVGVSLAQAFGFALQIPVIAIPKNKIPSDLRKLESIKGGKALTMNYGQKPNITTAKKRIKNKTK